MANLKTNIPEGSLVLVTGANGYVGSQVIKHFLERGYKVRGTVRDTAKYSWLLTDLFSDAAKAGKFELLEVSDMTAPHAFDAAVAGTSVIVHVASVVNADPNPEKVVPPTVAGATGILESALAEPSVLSFVYTSSIVAATDPRSSDATRVGPDSWNETAVKIAWSPPPYEPSRGSFVYAASKVAAEQAVWKFVKEKKPRFSVNAVNPSNILGEPLHVTMAASRTHWARAAFDGQTGLMQGLPSFWSVNVKDVAKLHVAAALEPGLENSRIQAWAQQCTWNDVLRIERKLFPDHKLIDDLPEPKPTTFSTDLTIALSLLKKWYGQDGWISLEDTIREDITPIVAWRAEGKI